MYRFIWQNQKLLSFQNVVYLENQHVNQLARSHLDVTSCARKVANYRYKKDLDYQKYLKAKAKDRVAKEKAEKAKKKAQETKAQKETEASRRSARILKITPKKKKK